MPKANQTKYYAVAVGRDAPNIYCSWDEYQPKVHRYSGAVHKSFRTREEAEKWLALTLAAPCNRAIAQPVKQVQDSTTTAYASQQAAPHPASTSSNCGAPLETKPDREELKVVLSVEQSKVLEKVKDGKNVFFTGSAGTGKSVLLREITRTLRNNSRRTAVAASTGIAALNIGGATLHSWAGIGLGIEPAKTFIGKVLGQPQFEQVLIRWRWVETLVIDEISMIDGSLFDKLEEIARGLRNSPLPFGGIQLVLCGDFCQLPPVSGRDEKGHEIPAKFAFESRSWDSCIGAPMVLTEMFRQKDQTFANMLNEMRYGRMQDSTIKTFKSLSRKIHYTDGIEPTEIYPTRKEVATANSMRLSQIRSEPSSYEAQDEAGVDHKGQRITHQKMLDLLDKLVAPKTLELKVGAQVMLIKNMRQGALVNGSIGKVISFETSAEGAASKTDIAIIESGGANGDKNTGISQEILKCDRKWPVVQFTNGLTLMMVPVDFTLEGGDRKMMARRVQLPLILAWALSVHKSQGQTLERVKVDLRRTFEKGQAYVALSRATNLEHLQVLNFQPQKVIAHPKVLAWYGQIASPQDIFNDEDLLAFREYHH